MRKIRFVCLVFVAFLPSFLKRIIYRIFFGYKIGKRVKIGLSIIDTKTCIIGDDVKIGHLNLFVTINKLAIGKKVHIGHLNIFRGGQNVILEDYVTVLRLNEINAIPEPRAVNEVDSTLILGAGSFLAASHKIDFTDRVTFGKCVVLGGRNSSLWTHNREATKSITIGDYTYLGSEIRIAPGGAIPEKCVVGMGSVITKKIDANPSLIAGVPAKIVNALTEEGLGILRYKTRPDLPDAYIEF